MGPLKALSRGINEAEKTETNRQSLPAAWSGTVCPDRKIVACIVRGSYSFVLRRSTDVGYQVPGCMIPVCRLDVLRALEHFIETEK